jgi:hypothetical protein
VKVSASRPAPLIYSESLHAAVHSYTSYHLAQGQALWAVVALLMMSNTVNDLLYCTVYAQCEGLVTGNANGGVAQQHYNLGWALYHATGVGGSTIPTSGTLAEVCICTKIYVLVQRCLCCMLAVSRGD